MVSECQERQAITELRNGFMSRFNQFEFVPLLEEVVLLPLCPQPSFRPIKSLLSFIDISMSCEAVEGAKHVAKD